MLRSYDIELVDTVSFVVFILSIGHVNFRDFLAVQCLIDSIYYKDLLYRRTTHIYLAGDNA